MSDNVYRTPEEYLEKRLRVQQKYHSQKASKAKSMFHWLSVLVLIISALIPILTTFLDVNSLIVKSIIATLSGTITVISGIQSLFKYQEIWVNYRVISESLKKLDFMYTTKTPPYDQANSFNLLVENCESILGGAKDDWKTLISSDQKKS